MLSAYHRLFLLLAACLIGTFPQLQAQSGTWAVSAGSPVQDYPEDVLVDAAGNSYVSGFFRDTLKLGSTTLAAAGNTDIFVAKYDVSGQLSWAKRYGWFENEFAHNMAFDNNGNVVLVGEYQDSIIFETDTVYSLDTLWYGPYAGTYDVFVLTIDPAGNLLDYVADGWFGSENFYDLAIDSRGYKYFAGMFRTYNFFGGNLWGAGYDDAFMVEMNDTGAFTWKSTAMGPYIDRGNAIDIVGDSLYIMGGTFQDTCWTRDSTVYHITNYEDDILVTAWDSAHSFRWSVAAGGPGKDHLATLKVNDLGEIYICGRYDTSFTFGSTTLPGFGGLDGFLAKLSPTGGLVWIKSLGGQGYDAALDLSLSAGGDVVVSGYFQGAADFGGLALSASDSLDQDAFVARFDANGNAIWAKRLGGLGLDKATSVEVDATDYIWVQGAFTGAAWFGQEKLVSNGGEDLFLLRMASDGSVGKPDPQSPAIQRLSAWPNPTSSQLHLAFELPRTAVASLRIVDLQGRVVAQPLASQRIGAGTHALQVDCSTWPSGMYLYRLEVEGQRFGGKIAVTR